MNTAGMQQIVFPMARKSPTVRVCVGYTDGDPDRAREWYMGGDFDLVEVGPERPIEVVGKAAKRKRVKVS